MRPKFHFAAKRNWINDPNGLCQADGLYHLYYQYNPDGPLWGNIHWGHAVSADLLHWQERPIALSPDGARGEKHCFSGGCCKDENGMPHFFYTSIGREEDGRGHVDGAEQWYAEPAEGSLDCLRQETGFTGAVHGDMTVTDWRDPCVLRHGGQYLMALGGAVEGRGCVLLYTSRDMRGWRYHSILAQAENPDGVPWECPNLFPLGDKMVLLYSPCAPVEALVGTLDENLAYHAEHREVLDPGGRRGFYAPQVFRDEGGRTILIGWMPEDDGDAAALRRGRSGQMALPRVLTLREGRLHAEPPEELRACLREVPAFTGRHGVARAAFRREALPLTLTLLATPDHREQTVITLSREGLLTLDLSRSSLSDEPGKAPIARGVTLQERSELFLAVDGTSVEVAVNGQWLSGRAYPTREDAGGLSLQSARPLDVTLEVWDD